MQSGDKLRESWTTWVETEPPEADESLIFSRRVRGIGTDTLDSHGQRRDIGFQNFRINNLTQHHALGSLSLIISHSISMQLLSYFVKSVSLNKF